MTRAERIKIRHQRIQNRIARGQRAQARSNAASLVLDANVTTTTTTTEIPEPLAKDKLTIEVCIHCYNYQHRLDWMLSSILQQKGDDVPDILVNVSYAAGNGNPTTEEVCKFFKEHGLNIKETVIEKAKASDRGFARNIQVKESTSDYMLFADSDLVYDPSFFDDLHKKIKAELWTITMCMGADRVSLDDKFCIKYFSEEDKTKYPCVIENVAEITSKWPVKWISGKLVAPGFFQLARTSVIRKRGNIYVGRSRDVWRGTYSDRAFRMRMRGRVPIEVRPQHHLNHDRGGPEIQR